MPKLARACAVVVAVATSLASGIAAAQIQSGVARKTATAAPSVALGVPAANANTNTNAGTRSNISQRSSSSTTTRSGSALSFTSGQPALNYQPADLPSAKDPMRREAVKDGAKESGISARGVTTATTSTTEFAPAPGVLRANMAPVNRTRTTWPDAFYTTTSYDAANRPSVIKENGTTSLASYAYDDLSQRTTVTLGNGTSIQRTYDNQSELPAPKRWCRVREQGGAATAAARWVLQGIRASDSGRKRPGSSAHRHRTRRGNLLHTGPLRDVHSSESIAGQKMAATKTMFEYADPPESMYEQDDFVLRVPPGIRSKAQLLESLASAGHFPNYFGGNWDALQDCLRDLSWIGNSNVVLVHSDLPLHSRPAECRTYLEILQAALVDWGESVMPDAGETPPGWSYVDHKLRVIFPTEASTVIARLVAGT